MYWEDLLMRQQIPYSSLTLLYLALCLLSPAFVLAEDLSQEGGDTSIHDASRRAFDHILANVTSATIQDKHDVGQEGFRRNFAKQAINGKIRLGPLFNNVSCVSCHTGNGRGTTSFGRKGSETILKVSQATGKPSMPGGPVPLRGFGLQIHDHARGKAKPDAHLDLVWELIQGSYEDNSPYELRRPNISVIPRRGKTFPSDAMTSLRRAPPVFGAGLLDAIDPSTIRSLADPDDADHDGISGRPNLVWNLQAKKQTLGKFGFKAAAPTLAQQIAAAYTNDMGVTNPLVRVGHDEPDISQKILDATTFYNRTLAVPVARSQDAAREKRGQDLFVSLGCNACHTMTITTGSSSVSELSHQTIHPFTDLLLHDMGPGLADGRAEFQATGNEWRTTPLWGIGLTETVLSGEEVTYLHDGRARTLAEAILWHGGESQAATDRFKALTEEQRTDLIFFLRSL